MLRFASLFFLFILSLYCVLSSLHWAKYVFLKILTFINPLLISILHNKQKYFKNLCKKICQYKNNL